MLELCAAQRHESVTFRAAGTSLSGQAQGDGILVDVQATLVGRQGRGRGAAPARASRHDLIARQTRPRAAWLSPWPRSGKRIGLHDRRRHRQQLKRHVLRHDSELLQDAVVAHLHAAIRHDDRHAPRGCRTAFRRRRAGARRRPDEIKRRDRIGPGPCRAAAQEVQHQEHDRLSHGGIPRRCDPAARSSAG